MIPEKQQIDFLLSQTNNRWVRTIQTFQYSDDLKDCVIIRTADSQ